MMLWFLLLARQETYNIYSFSKKKTYVTFNQCFLHAIIQTIFLVLDMNLAKKSLNVTKGGKLGKFLAILANHCKSSFDLTNFLTKNIKTLILCGLEIFT